MSSGNDDDKVSAQDESESSEDEQRRKHLPSDVRISIEEFTPSLRQALESQVHSPMIRAVFKGKIDEFARGTAELNISDTSTLWSDMFKERHSVVYLRATSLIDPKIWDNEFMRKYEGEQRKVVEYLNNLKKNKGADYRNVVNSTRDKLRARFANSELAWFNSFMDTNFERTFIVKKEQAINSDTLRKLSALISSQSSYMSVRFAYEKKVSIDDSKDYAIAISKEGDVLLYDLLVIGGELYGGRITYNHDKIKEAIKMYRHLEAPSAEIPRNSSPATVENMIMEAAKADVAVVTPMMEKVEAKKIAALHMCALCFVRTEIKMGNMKDMKEIDWDNLPPDTRDEMKILGEIIMKTEAPATEGYYWQDLSPEERYWYGIIYIENTKILEYVKKEKPKRIIEVGCGPGRLISQILKIKDYDYEEMVGIDGDRLMSEIARLRFRDKYPKISIFGMTVKNKLPYPNDRFDFCINAMNIVGWQGENDKEWLKEMLRCSNSVFFTLYKKGREKERKAMYEKRGHKPEEVVIDKKTEQVQLRDCATNPCVFSKAYGPLEAENICREAGSRFDSEYDVTYSVDKDSNELLYLCYISKKRKVKKETEDTTFQPKIELKRVMVEQIVKDAQPFIVIGSTKEKVRHWGVIGKSDKGLVRFDLDAPHIVFVCGKQGSGKGYTIGVLCEMLSSPSIEGLSNVSKKATIVVLHKPNEDKKSEFWSMTKPNDDETEVAKIKSEYRVNPRSILSDHEIRIFVDPSVYPTKLQEFKKEYGTEEVYPLRVDTSSLGGEEWEIFLSTGGTGNEEYIEKLTRILGKSGAPALSVSMKAVKKKIESELKPAQRQLAEERLRFLKNYVADQQQDDFVSKLAIGGVNIFDFRKIQLPSRDTFSLMTLILSVLQTRKNLQNEPFVFVMNEAHFYFKKGISEPFTASLANLIRRKRWGLNWLLLDTQLPEDIDKLVLQLSDVKIVHFLDKMTSGSQIIKDMLGESADMTPMLVTGHCIVVADESSEGRQPIKVEIRPRLSKHGAAPKPQQENDGKM